MLSATGFIEKKKSVKCMKRVISKHEDGILHEMEIVILILFH
ncbi:Uncharacterized protein APZ42_004040 [Daphnia magna]|uniref:Uncharacterized protein n=1 Tax=Daphnia magna TaxID=35525 RepID=A0A162CVU6_9CRUS|nr:Uncharacterized protein APZ42_004040 [Daphnia magna]